MATRKRMRRHAGRRETTHEEWEPVFKSLDLRASVRGAGDGRGGRLSNDDVEEALITGDHAHLLEGYFGQAEYAELRELATAGSRTIRGRAPRVYVLHGILGSELEVEEDGRVDEAWVHFWNIRYRGILEKLRHPDRNRAVRSFRVIEFAYRRILQVLRASGFDARPYHYDWRLSLDVLGRRLKADIEADPAADVAIVAHSMGGLVARAAFGIGLPKATRLIMLGTPNHGSFSPVEVFWGVHGLMGKIDFIDRKHDIAGLAEIFATMPGLVQMMPAPSHYSRLNLYEPAAWSMARGRPDAALLKNALAVQKCLAVDPERFLLIAGVNQKTKVDARIGDDGKIEFLVSPDGDGTVPREFALLPGVRTWYAPADHGTLPNDRAVAHAVVDLLRGGDTNVFPSQWSPARTQAGQWIPAEAMEAACRAALPAQLRAADLRGFARGFIAPMDADRTPVAASDIGQGAAVPFRGLVIGRKRQRRLDVRLACGSITQVKSRAYVLGYFANMTPGGAVASVDAHMDGAIREFIERRMLSGAVGEVFMVPSGRNELRSDFVLLAGLGHYDAFQASVLQAVAENVARTLARTDIEEFATVLIGGGLEQRIGEVLSHLMRGFLRGIVGADPAHQFRSVTFCEVDAGRYEDLKWALYNLASSPLFEDVELTMHEMDVLPAQPAIESRAAASAAEALYLTVRCVEVDASAAESRFETAVLAPSGKAAVFCESRVVSNERIRSHLEKYQDYLDRKNDRLDPIRWGSEFAGLILQEGTLKVLAANRVREWVVIHDRQSSIVPWETLSFGSDAPAVIGGMTRRYLADNLSVAKWMDERRADGTLGMLLVGDPTGDLGGARDEIAWIRDVLKGMAGVSVKVILGPDATRPRLMSEFDSGRYDVVHYAGHAFFDPARAVRSGLICAGNETLTGADLAGLRRLPGLVVFNACESARLRLSPRGASGHVGGRGRLGRAARLGGNADDATSQETTCGAAEALLRGGLMAFLGTYWPVGDRAAEVFAEKFYTAILAGEPLGTAVVKARCAIKAGGERDWADYILFGSSGFVIKQLQ